MFLVNENHRGICEMKYIFIDTCIYIQCCLLEIEGDDIGALKRVRDLLSQQKAILLLPEVVELEFNKILKNKLKALKEMVGYYQEDINKNNELDKKIKSDLITKIKEVVEERAANTEKAIKEIEILFNNEDTIKLPIKGEHLVFAYKDFLSSEKPHKPKQRGEIQPDSVIISSLSECLANKDGYSFYFCSSNTEDFSVIKNDELVIHPEISKQFKSINFYSNLYDLLNKDFGAKYTKSSIEKLEEKRAETDSDLVFEADGLFNDNADSLVVSQNNYFNEGAQKLVSVFWPSVINNIRQKNSTLAALLRDCKIESVKNEVKVFTKFKFHFDRLSQHGAKQLIEDSLLKLTNRNYIVTIYSPEYYKSV